MTHSDLDGTSPEVTWSLPISWVAFMVFVMTVMVIAGVLILVRTVSGQSGPPLWFLALWFIGGRLFAAGASP